MTRAVTSIALVLATLCASAEVSFDMGADFRVRQEIYDNAPGLPGGGLNSTSVRGRRNA